MSLFRILTTAQFIVAVLALLISVGLASVASYAHSEFMRKKKNGILLVISNGNRRREWARLFTHGLLVAAGTIAFTIPPHTLGWYEPAGNVIWVCILLISVLTLGLGLSEQHDRRTIADLELAAAARRSSDVPQTSAQAGTAVDTAASMHVRASNVQVKAAEVQVLAPEAQIAAAEEQQKKP